MAGLWLIVGGLAGMELILWSGLVPISFGDCPPFPQCYKHGHPHDWIGVLVLVAAIVGAVIFSGLGTNLKAASNRRRHP